ncbi:MAG: hypothetical protein L3V56_03840 [Candidatus Magnetoovum sp. WYHC-5]|nr:hypothetical protein [Candidatus Magnetoovum sp. WYHC-5]
MADVDVKEKDMKTIAGETEGFKCVIQKAIHFLNEFIAGPMCARCMPCPMASYELRTLFEKMVKGFATDRDIESIKKIAPLMFATSMCKKGKDTAKFIMDTIANAMDVYNAHVAGLCPDRQCTALYVYRVIEDKCVMCDECRQVCKSYAVLGEKKVAYMSGFGAYEIVNKRCTRCGDCLKVCLYNAIEVADVNAPAACSRSL